MTNEFNEVMQAATENVVTLGMNVDQALNDALAKFPDAEFAEDELGVIRHEITAAKARKAYNDQMQAQSGETDSEFADDDLAKPYDEQNQTKIEDFNDDGK